jgi:hypothetical protein
VDGRAHPEHPDLPRNAANQTKTEPVGSFVENRFVENPHHAQLLLG